jgi:hypothetical protein
MSVGWGSSRAARRTNTSEAVMAMKIVILEDNAERRAAMRACLDDRLYTFEPHFFVHARDVIAFLSEFAEQTIAISLDHDLEPSVSSELGIMDPGTGRNVADFLVGRAPFCPVLIHTSNLNASSGMEMLLADAGWITFRVAPYGDLDWIWEQWLPTLRKAVLNFSRAPVAAGAKQ